MLSRAPGKGDRRIRVAYILRSVAHWAYHEAIVLHLVKRGHSVVVLFDQEWSKGFADATAQSMAATTPGLSIGWSLRRNDSWRGPLFTLREVRSYASYLRRKDQSPYYLARWEGYLPGRVGWLARHTFGRLLLATGLAELCFRAFERLVPPDSAIKASLESNRPDVVMASPVNMRFSEEVEYIKAARALRIPTVLPVISWDNLTTKGLVHVIPDLTLVWNQTQLDEATHIHGIPNGKLLLTGSPFFDKWFEAGRAVLDRETFCKKVGLDPSRPYVVYLGSSANIAEDETWLVRDIIKSMRSHRDPRVRALNLLIRPHPANAAVYRALSEEGVSLWPRGGALPADVESIQDFEATLRYSVATVGINTTAMIDAVIADRSCITITSDRYRATQMQAAHFHHLLRADVLEIARDGEECASHLEAVVHGVDRKRDARARFVQDFIRPRGLSRPAGWVIARAIEALAYGSEPEEIEEVIERSEDLAMAGAI